MNTGTTIESTSPLFSGIEAAELSSLLGCLNARKKSYPKGSTIYQVGEPISAVGLILSGTVHICQEDFWGNRTILSAAGPGQLFGEAYACTGVQALAVRVVAAENAEIQFLDVRRIFTTCPSACSFHARLIQNLVHVLAQKDLMLTQKMEHLSKRTTREKLLSYLSAESQKTGSAAFTIPFNRQQLAEYLCVDRSAMSNELCKMQREGLLTFERSRFHLQEGSVLE